DHVLAPPHHRLEHNSWKLETRRACRLRKSALDQRRNEHGVDLEALRLMDRHDLNGVAPLGRGRLLVLARQGYQLEVAPRGSQRMVGRRLAEPAELLAQ